MTMAHRHPLLLAIAAFAVTIATLATLMPPLA